VTGKTLATSINYGNEGSGVFLAQKESEYNSNLVTFRIKFIHSMKKEIIMDDPENYLFEDG
jgi:hypothetical protein